MVDLSLVAEEPDKSSLSTKGGRQSDKDKDKSNVKLMEVERRCLVFSWQKVKCQMTLKSLMSVMKTI